MIKLHGYKIILASSSPRRKIFFDQLGIPFDVKSLPVDESFPVKLRESKISEFIVGKKNLPFRDIIEPKQIIITADTIVWCRNKYFGKPDNLYQARNMLNYLSGKTHEVITSVGFLTYETFEIITEKTYVHFKNLTGDEISHYLDLNSPLDKAGGYGIQDWIGEIGITKIEGSYTNVVGLPLALVLERIKFLTKNK